MQVAVLVVSIIYASSKWIQLIKYQNTILQSYVSVNDIPIDRTQSFEIGKSINGYTFSLAFGILNYDYVTPPDLAKIGYYSVYMEQWV